MAKLLGKRVLKFSGSPKSRYGHFIDQPLSKTKMSTLVKKRSTLIAIAISIAARKLIKRVKR